MLFGLFKSRSERRIRRYRSPLATINSLAERFANLSSEESLRYATTIRERATNGEDHWALLPEAFALTREVAKRKINLRPYDVQVLGGCALFDGCIAEMKTGEGKTLAAVLPAATAALCGTPVHMITVNDYLAQRDATWMAPVYNALGLTSAVCAANSDNAARRAAYASDITYGTNNEFGFDYLRDNMRYQANTRTQRDLGFAIIDEVDSVLIDEARTPLAISGSAGDLTSMYLACNKIARTFHPCGQDKTEGHFTIDEKSRAVHLTDEGYDLAEELFAQNKMMRADGGLYESHNLQLLHHLVAALRAWHLFTRDREYVVSKSKVIIVDEHTGRLQPGRRWGDGLHQALEAKEGTQIEQESQTLASITLQNFARQYRRLAGMTGTAQTEAEEFRQIYDLEVVSIPTNQPMIRTDKLDRIYRTTESKLRNSVADIAACHQRGQPVLVGTTSIEGSEQVSLLLSREKIEHEVLNAKNHAREADIIAQAGMPGAVTIATNMAGRGIDIVLGGNIEIERNKLIADPDISAAARAKRLASLENEWNNRHHEVVAAGGLHVIGTERHESRRIDNQLRGRSGRQGDPGTSVFYLSFEDPLLRIFAAERVSGIMQRLKIDEDEAIEAGMVTRVISNAQAKVEGHNFDIRKQLLEYDDIINDQRKIIYTQREDIITATDITPIANEMVTDAARAVCADWLPANAPEEQWQPDKAEQELGKLLPIETPIQRWLEQDDHIKAPDIANRVAELAKQALSAKVAELGTEHSAEIGTMIILNVIDSHWRNHLSSLEHLRMGIGLRGFAQKNPKQEYRREALEMFNHMIIAIRRDAARLLTTVRLREKPPPAPQATRPIEQATAIPSPPTSPTPTSEAKRPRRNDPCPCGSGKKYKNCHGRLR